LSLLFLVFKHDFIRCVDFAPVSQLLTARDDITNKVTQRIFNTDLLYSFAQFIFQIDEKFSLNDDF